MNVYATLDQLKKALTDITSTSYDVVLVDVLSRASRMIDALTDREFYPTLATRYLDSQGTDRLWLPWPLLSITTLQISSDHGSTYGYTPVENTDFFSSDGIRWGETPYQHLVMAVNSSSYDVFYAGQRAVKITGIWGWRRNYSRAWVASGDTVNNVTSISAAGTSLTVNDADGADGRGLTPRFSPGNLIKIESEYLAVTAVNTTTNILTVVRGQNGTTAAAHVNGTAISTWLPEEIVIQATLTQAGRWFKRGQQAYQDMGAAFEMGQFLYAQELDPDVRAVLFGAGLRRLTVG